MSHRDTSAASVRALRLGLALILFCFSALPTSGAGQRTAIEIVGPANSSRFGTVVRALANGNIVVTDPACDGGKGAAYLYDGRTGDPIAALKGSQPGDAVGSGGVVALTNGNYVVMSPEWDNGTAANAGAVTWGHGTTGIAGEVSAANSLVGSHTGDFVGDDVWTGDAEGVIALANGNYLVVAPEWDNDTAVRAGAVTWGNGSTGIVGEVSAANSLVGSRAGDHVGLEGVVVLANGNYVVLSPYWNSATAVGAGAVTWGNGSAGIVGEVSPANSLVGSRTSDGVGGVVALANGNYVVVSAGWDNATTANAGAVTWGNGSTGIVGEVSTGNSLVGTQSDDLVGLQGVIALVNGNYVVLSPGWANATAVHAGAVTWGNGTTGSVGEVSAANSLTGSRTGDRVGWHGSLALANGNYVVRSPNWDSATAVDAGAVTWGDGTTGSVGEVSAGNSVTGSRANDQVGSGGVVALTNGNYVVVSPDWDSAAVAHAGAVTWGNGTTGSVGEVSAAGSLVGSRTHDQLGSGGVVALANGNYVVLSPYWTSATAVAVGAVTWGNGSKAIVGEVSAANSLVGSQPNDGVGWRGVALANGNYVVMSSGWDSATAANAGAVTWGNGTTGIVGEVSAANSLVGSQPNDGVGWRVVALANGNYAVMSVFWNSATVANAGAVTWGNGTTGIVGEVSAANSLAGSHVDDSVGWTMGAGGVIALANGDYVVESPYWDNATAVNAGAVTWGNGTTGTFGPITVGDSVMGTKPGGGLSQRWVFDPVNNQLVVGRPADNTVSLLRTIVWRVHQPVALR